MKQALEMALEALEKADKIRGFPNNKKAITAIKEALAQPEQEPVAVVDANDEGYWADILPDRNVKVGQFLYTTPPQRKPLTENEIKHLWYEACQTNLELTSQLIVHLARNIEAAHGIKE